MTNFTKRAVLVILAVAVIVGCKKDDKNNGSSKTQLITSGNWKVTSDYYDPAVDWDGDGHTENEVFSLYSACDKDDILVFKTDGSLTFDEGASKCDPSDPQVIETTSWKFSNNETVLLVGPSGSETSVQLLELSSTTLKIKVPFTAQGVNYTETTTYSH
ncbi:lipocalin family protein [Chitinophagaceae bacterium 26-R-25]|nr:lipocalin family protein [Chitinophagaceae bacterium 26-R-25]